MVQWIDIGLVTPTAAQAVSASANLVFFWRYARTTASTARRVASTTLAMLSGALCLEAVAFLGFGWRQLDEESALPILATLLVRWALVCVTALLSLLIWRSPLRRAQER
jgi:hypothetical protein